MYCTLYFVVSMAYSCPTCRQRFTMKRDLSKHVTGIYCRGVEEVLDHSRHHQKVKNLNYQNAIATAKESLRKKSTQKILNRSALKEIRNENVGEVCKQRAL